MKTETKISKLAIICALCTVAVSPAISAAPVRSLGGTGTYSSASSAATSKATGTSATSARAGAVRVLPSTTKAASGASVSAKPSATTTASTRVAATPRLSLGKYLAGNRVVSPSGGSSSGGGSAGGEFVGLEDWVNHLTAYRELEDTIGKLDERVIALEDKAADGVSQAELDAAIAGVQTQIDDLNTVVAGLPADIVGGEELAAAIATLKSELSDVETVEGLSASVKTLQEDLLAVQGQFADYVLKADFEARSKAVDLEIEKINSAAGELIVRVASLEDKTNGGVAGEQDFIDLSNTVAELEAGLDNVKAQLPADGSATATAAQVQVVEEAIGVIEGLIPESGIAPLATVTEMGETVDSLSESVAALDAKVAQNVLKTEYEAKVVELDQEIADLMAGLANYYTKTETDAAIAVAVKPINDWLTEERRVQIEADLTSLEALIGAQKAIAEYATADALEQVKSQLEDITKPDGEGMATQTDLNNLDVRLSGLIEGLADSDTLTAGELERIQGNLDLNYYTKDQADAKFAKKDEVATYITEGSITTEMIESIDASKVTGQLTSSQLADGSVTPNKISTGETVLADGQLGMLVSDGAGGLRWAAIDVAM